MLPDGRWESLSSAEKTKNPAEMTPGTRLDWNWSVRPAHEKFSEISRIQPMMVRFFDQAGVSFGQISFFQQPPVAQVNLHTQYRDAELQISAPQNSSVLQASWLLWPQEEGISSIDRAVNFTQQQPDAAFFDWKNSELKQYVATGLGQPAAVLLHQTPQGYRIQFIQGGGLQGRQQRSAWLVAGSWFYGLGVSLAVMATVLFLFARFMRKPLQSQSQTLPLNLKNRVRKNKRGKR
ncbi:MAG: hypothetical protein WC742_11875 [Gallionellaceae bacterium]